MFKNIPAQSGHVGISGIQAHSAGEIFPYTIVIKGCGLPSQCIYAMSPQGEELTHFGYHDDDAVVVGVSQIWTFKEAHKAATDEARQALLAEAA